MKLDQTYTNFCQARFSDKNVYSLAIVQTLYPTPLKEPKYKPYRYNEWLRSRNNQWSTSNQKKIKFVE